MPAGFFVLRAASSVIRSRVNSLEQISGLGIESVLLISPKIWPVKRERKQDGSSAPRFGAVLVFRRSNLIGRRPPYRAR
jgi:hypothetical protein